MYKAPMPMQLTDQDIAAAGVLPAFYRGPQGEPGPGADVVLCNPSMGRYPIDAGTLTSLYSGVSLWNGEPHDLPEE